MLRYAHGAYFQNDKIHKGVRGVKGGKMILPTPMGALSLSSSF